MAKTPFYVDLEKAPDDSVQDVPLGFTAHADATDEKLTRPALLRWEKHNTTGIRH